MHLVAAVDLCISVYGWFLGRLYGQRTSLPATLAATEVLSKTPTVTPIPPSPTPEPLVAQVNGDEILLSDFESEWQRYQSAQTGEIHNLGGGC